MTNPQHPKGDQIRLLCAYSTCIAGMILMFTGLAVPPTGVIDHSVLIALGEILTFSGALLGIHIRYRQ